VFLAFLETPVSGVRIPAVFSDFMTPAACVHSYETRYTTHGNLHRTGIRTDYGRFMIRYKAAQVWETVPTYLKRLTGPAFEKQ